MTQTSRKYFPDQPSEKLAPMAANASETKKAEKKLFAVSQESTEYFTKSTDAVTKTLNDALASSCENIETCIECGNLTATLATDIGSKVHDYTNKTFSDASELTKELFTCRTINEMFELQNKIVKNTMDNFFNQSSKLSDRMFEYANQVLEPVVKMRKESGSNPKKNPPPEWFKKRRASAKNYRESGETVAAEDYEIETNEIAEKYAAGDQKAIKTVNEETKNL